MRAVKSHSPVNREGETELGYWFSGAALGASSVQLLGFFQPVAVSLDVDDLGAMDEAVDEGDDAGRMGKDLAPFGEGLVGAEEDGLVGVVAACDDLEEEVGVAVVVRKIANL